MGFSKTITMAAYLGSTALSLSFARADETATAVTEAAPLSELIITAQKRSSTVQQTPISISAIGADELEARGMVDFSVLAAATPNVSLKSEGPGQTEIELRGMASSGGNSPTVGFYLDDTPLTAPASAQNGKVVINPDLYDLNRIEVLRGPQGTLYGSGSMGGTVRLITNQPDNSAYHASAQSILSGTDGGGFNHADNLMVNLPLVDDKLALRIVGSENFTSGWIDRIVAGNFPLVSTDGSTRGDVRNAPVIKDYHGSNAQQTYGARVTLQWKPTDDLTITPSFLYQSSHQDGISAYDSTPGTMAHYQPFDIPEPLTDRIAIYGVTANYVFPTFDITSVTSYWTRLSTQTEDGSENFNSPTTDVTVAANNGLSNPGYYGPNGSGEVYGHETDPSSQFSEELRFSSIGDGPLQWVGGAFLSNFRSVWNFQGRTPNASSYMDIGTFAPATTQDWFDAYSPTQLIQYAVFGESTYAITNALKATVGLRWYAYDYRYSSTISGWGTAFGAAAPAATGLISQYASGVNPKFNLSYDFDTDVMGYFTVSRGARPGGGNALYPTTGPYWSAVFAPYNFANGKWPTSYQPDSVWSYELGEKARFFDKRLTIDSSVYYEDWQNIQLEATPGDWPENINGEHAGIFGGEIESKASLGAGFTASAGAGFTHVDLDAGPHWQIVPKGKLPDVAPLTFDLSLSYAKPITDKYSFTALIENNYVGQRYSISFPIGYTTNSAYVPLPAYDLTNIRAGVMSDDGWTASLFVNNLFNKHAQLENLWQETLPAASFNRIVTNQPMTGGVDMSVKF